MKYKTFCKNPWCKATFEYSEEDMIEVDGVKTKPKNCKKCISFDTELSGGISWKEHKYTGDPFKGDSIEIKHEIKYNK